MTRFDVSANGEKMLFGQARTLVRSLPTTQPLQAGRGRSEAGRHGGATSIRAPSGSRCTTRFGGSQRDFFYDPGFTAWTSRAAEKRYEPYSSTSAHRGDLNYLFQEMLGDLSVGHLYVGRRRFAGADAVQGGLLGADYAIENGRYRFAKHLQRRELEPGSCVRRSRSRA